MRGKLVFCLGGGLPSGGDVPLSDVMGSVSESRGGKRGKVARRSCNISKTAGNDVCHTMWAESCSILEGETFGGQQTLATILEGANDCYQTLDRRNWTSGQTL